MWQYIRVHQKTIFWFLLIGLHVLAFSWQFRAEPWLLEDSHEYLAEAGNLWEHETMYCGNWTEPERVDDYTKRPPVYPVLLGLFRVDQLGFFSLFLFQSMLSIGGIWLISNLLIKRLSVQPPWLLWSVLLLLTPSQWIYPQLVMTETLFQFLLIGIGTCLWISWTEKSVLAWLLGTVLMVLAFLTKPVWYLFTIVWLLWGVGLFIRQRRILWLPVAVFPLLVLWGYMSWNEARTGYFHMSSIQHLSLLQYTTANLLTDVYGVETGTAKADSILYLSLSQGSYEQQQRQLQQACASVIWSHKAAYVMMHAKGMVNFFLDPGRFDLWEFFRLKKGETGLLAAFSQGGYAGVWQALRKLPVLGLLYLLMILLANMVKTAGLALFLFQRRKEAIAWVLLLMFGYLAGVTGTSGAARFALPLFPWLLVAATSWSFLSPQTEDSSKKTVE